MSDLSIHEFQGSGSEWDALLADLPGAHLFRRGGTAWRSSGGRRCPLLEPVDPMM
jgi:hypothetical protein